MGATSGIGLHLARRYAAMGWTVGAAGRNAGALAQLSADYPGQIKTSRIDVTDPAAPRLMEELIERMEGMDIYLHVAGIGFDNPNLEVDKDCAVMEVNAVGFTRMVATAFRWFRDRNGGRGHIAAITSVAATAGIGQFASYSASKSCQQVYLQGLSQLNYLQHLKIKITDIRPGWIRTPLLDGAMKYPMLMQLPYAEERIVRALRRGSRVAYIDWRWGLTVRLWRLIPGWLWIRLPLRLASICSRGSGRGNQR